MVVFALTNRERFTVIFLNTFTYLFAVANAFVVQFREQPIMLMDLKSFKTAASVAGEYEYVLTVNMVLMGLLMLLCNLWILNMEFRFLNWKYRITYGVFTCVCIYCSIQGMFAGNLFEKAGSAGLDFFRFNLNAEYLLFKSKRAGGIFARVCQADGRKCFSKRREGSRTSGKCYRSYE